MSKSAKQIRLMDEIINLIWRAEERSDNPADQEVLAAARKLVDDHHNPAPPEGTETPWQQYKRAGKSGCGSYLQAELVAVHRAIHILKTLGPGQKMKLEDLHDQAIQYANKFPGIGAKYREAVPRIDALADLGLIAIDSDPEDRETKVVRITVKGFLATPQEWEDEVDEVVEEGRDIDMSAFDDVSPGGSFNYYPDPDRPESSAFLAELMSLND